MMSRYVKGLLIKDIRLLRSQMKFFLAVIVAWGSFMVMQFAASVFIGYSSIMCSFLTLTTFSYDEVDNAAAFLFTLPISKKDYMREKYLLGFLMACVPYLVTVTASWAVLAARGESQGFLAFVMSTAGGLLIAFLLLALEIPIYTRFGQEKSRMVTLICVVFMSAAFGVIAHFNDPDSIDGARVAAWIEMIGPGAIMLVSAAILAVLFLISYKLSCRFLEKREF